MLCIKLGRKADSIPFIYKKGNLLLKHANHRKRIYMGNNLNQLVRCHIDLNNTKICITASAAIPLKEGLKAEC